MSLNNSILTVSTPGRICLFGEHQDYLGLPIIAGAISLRIAIKGKKREDNLININLPDVGLNENFKLEIPVPYEAERDYFKSVVNVLSNRGFTFSKGTDCEVQGTIPINAGTSSSSALIVSWVNFLALQSDQAVQLSPENIAQIAYEAEVLEFSEPGGMMDQYSTSIGNLIYLESYPEIRVEKINAKLGSFILGNSHQPKDTIYILARVKKQILDVVKNLKINHPGFSLQTAKADEIDELVNELTAEQNSLLKATIKNRDITRNARELFAQNEIDHKEVGRLLTEHHRMLNDPLQISTPKIEGMIEAALNAGAYGAKINGSGGGGCMFAYAPENPEKVKEAIENAGGEAFIINIDAGTTAGFNGGVKL